MKIKIFKIIGGTCPYVLLFGVFVIISLLLQCFIPFLQKMAALGNENWAWFLAMFNDKFVLPMELISNFWAAISATYVGLDRAAYSIDALKNGNDKIAMDVTRMNQLVQVIWLSFVIYSLSVGLNTFFDAELALTPLFVSFGSSVLCYIAGNKAVRAFERLNKKDSTIKGMNNQQLTTLDTIAVLMKEKKEIVIKIDQNAKIVGIKS